jgi:hypothetical protein
VGDVTPGEGCVSEGEGRQVFTEGRPPRRVDSGSEDLLGRPRDAHSRKCGLRQEVGKATGKGDLRDVNIYVLTPMMTPLIDP